MVSKGTPISIPGFQSKNNVKKQGMDDIDDITTKDARELLESLIASSKANTESYSIIPSNSFNIDESSKENNNAADANNGSPMDPNHIHKLSSLISSSNNSTDSEDSFGMLDKRRTHRTHTGRLHSGSTIMGKNPDGSTYIFNPNEPDTRLPSLKHTCASNMNAHKPFLTTYNRGKFSVDEINKVDAALHRYLETKNVNICDLELLLNRKTKSFDLDTGLIRINPYSELEYATFIKDIHTEARINRTLHQIYIFIKRKYGQVNNKNKPWSEEEDNQLLNLVKEEGPSPRWAYISRLLKRNDVQRRYNKVKGYKEKKISMGRFTIEEDNKLYEYVQIIMKRDGLDDPSLVNNWTEISIQMKTRNPQQLQSRWIKYYPDIIKRYEQQQIQQQQQQVPEHHQPQPQSQPLQPQQQQQSQQQQEPLPPQPQSQSPSLQLQENRQNIQNENQ